MSTAEKSWSEALKNFSRHLRMERALARNTSSAYLSDLEDFCRFMADSHPTLTPEQVTTEHIRGYILELGSRVADEQYGTTYSAKSQSRRLSSLRSFFHLLLIENRISENPTEQIEGPKIGRYLPDVLSPEEVEAIIEATAHTGKQATRNRAIVEMLYGCGLRVSELTALRISDLFFKEELVRVAEGKGGKMRWVPLNHHAMHCVEEWLSERSLFDISAQDSDRVFINYQGKGLSRQSVFKMVRQAALIAGVTKELSPHSFRHSFATHLLEGGASIRQVQDMLGHSSLNTTEIYTHLDSRRLAETIDQYHPLGKE